MVLVEIHSNSKFDFSSGPKIKIEDAVGKKKNISNLNKPPRQKCVYLNMQLAALASCDPALSCHQAALLAARKCK